MTKSDFVNEICNYARTTLASKANSKLTQFALGSCTVGIGRNIVESKLSPLLDMCTDECGNINIEGLKASIIGGFEISKQVPILGGIISLDADDANDFFCFIEKNSSKDSLNSQIK